MKPNPRRHVFAALLMVISYGLLGCTKPNPHETSAHIVIENVVILDGRGGAPLTNRRVEIRNGSIIRIDAPSMPKPQGATVIDGHGKYLMPGFIDMHAHLLFPRCQLGDGPPIFDRKLSERALSRYLEFGITTVRSPATPTIEGLKLRDDLNAHNIKGPRAFAAAELINDAQLTEPQLRLYVRDTLPYKPDYIKVYARLKPWQVAVVTDEAHKNGLKVIGHLQTTTWQEGTNLGVDHFAHSVDWSAQSLPLQSQDAYRAKAKQTKGFKARLDWLEAFDPDAKAHDALIKSLTKSGVSVDVTLVAYDGKFTRPETSPYRHNTHLSAFPELRHDWQTCDEATKDWTDADYRRWDRLKPKLFKWVKRMHDAGVLLVSGTDATNEWVIPGESLHQEFELLAQSGLTPAQILKMTGVNAAKALNRPDIGVIEAGAKADLVLVSKDPMQNISHTRSIIWVMQGGKIVSNTAPK